MMLSLSKELLEEDQKLSYGAITMIKLELIDIHHIYQLFIVFICNKQSVNFNPFPEQIF